MYKIACAMRFVEIYDSMHSLFVLGFETGNFVISDLSASNFKEKERLAVAKPKTGDMY